MYKETAYNLWLFLESLKCLNENENWKAYDKSHYEGEFWSIMGVVYFLGIDFWQEESGKVYLVKSGLHIYFQLQCVSHGVRTTRDGSQPRRSTLC